MNTQVQTQAAQSQLINVFIGQINGVPAHVCDGRELHTFLENGSLFANWIKERVEKYGFVENHDFAIALEKTKTIRKYKDGTEREGTVTRKDYHLSLDMAKELSMVENNDKGREARRYFIDMEKKAIAAAGQVVPPSHTETLTPSEQQTLSEIAHRKAEPFGTQQGKALAEIWSRLHNKFRIAKYSQLPRTQLADAIVYVTSMEVRSAKPTSSAPEVLSASDMHNITRLVWLMTHNLRFDKSWAQAIWRQLRQIVDTPSPNRFTVDQVPKLADELTRIYAITDSFSAAVASAERAMIKRVMRDNEAADAVLAEMRSKLMAAATEEIEQASYFFQRFAGKELEHFAKRLPNLGARYPHAEEKAA